MTALRVAVGDRVSEGTVLLVLEERRGGAAQGARRPPSRPAERAPSGPTAERAEPERIHERADPVPDAARSTTHRWW